MAAKPVAIIMGSQSDWPTMRHAAETLDALGVGYDSAHRLGAPHAGPALCLRQGRQGGRLQGDHRGRRRRRAPARHDRRDDHAAGVRRAGRIEGAVRASIRSIRSCRCRRACRSARSRSARPAPSMPRCSPRACWRSPIAALATRLEAWRKRQTEAVAERRRRGRGVSAHAPAARARRHHRHSRRRPARPHAGAGGGAARLQVPRALPRAAIRRPSTWCAA